MVKPRLLTRSLLIGLLLFSFVVQLKAQCVPTLSGTDFVAVPDTLQNLPVAYFPSSYEATVQMYIPTDTFVDMLNLVLPLDSLFITGITGLPVSFEYEVYPSAGPIPGGSPICLQITNPSVYVEVEGVHPLLIHVLAWSVGLPANGDITGYTLKVEPLPVGISEPMVEDELLRSNLITGHSLSLNSDAGQTMMIIHSDGRMETYTTASGTIDIGDLSDGIYVLKCGDRIERFAKVSP
jgi:hypothetical protein